MQPPAPFSNIHFAMPEQHSPSIHHPNSNHKLYLSFSHYMNYFVQYRVCFMMIWHHMLWCFYYRLWVHQSNLAS
uniref:Putative ovule protein n=1 Tax=Solanum chacoense TaxID=4108 RepID=A0A0V0GT47_SOLCH